MQEAKQKTSSTPDNGDWQGVDKSPEEELGKKEKVTKEDLKGKKVDADPETEDRKTGK